ncbi:MAG: formate dehydrogenase subunit alpha [Succinivibrionaceae bacterium]|nr:formate dehydrogenase subunit alpha [Succinivibrionaceae bacterium]
MDKTITVTVDGKTVKASPDETILEVARRSDIYIPTLCYLKDVNDIGACRMCVVEVEGHEHLYTSCNTKVKDGMVIFTHSEKVKLSREFVLQLILANHDVRCLSCSKSGDCELQNLSKEFDLPIENPYRHKLVKLESVTANPFLSYYPELCIGCQRCVSTCNKVVGNGVLRSSKVGTRTFIDAPFGEDWKNTKCELCGNCAKVCPTGALVAKNMSKYRLSKVEKVLTTCPHCATGCQMYLMVKNNKVVDVRPADGPSNKGLLCVKGRFGSFNFIHSPERLKYPLIRNKETGKFEQATWDEALDLIATKFKAIKAQYGADALAGFACSRSPNEDCYMLQKMVRCAFGTNNVDNCARVCHSASVAGLAMTLGSGAMTNPIADITGSDVDVIMLVGSNPEEAHPVVGMQIRQAVSRGAHLIVVDPRDIGLSREADIHLKLKPGTNVAFANGMMHIFIEEGLVDEEFIKNRTEGFEELKEIVKDYTPEYVSKICHIDPDHLREAARMYATAGKAPIIYCLGVTEHSTGTEGVMSMSNMAMMVGKLGRPGCGVNPLRGQNNVQGACDMGAMPGDMPGYQKITNEDVMKKFEKSWGVKLSRKQGLHATDVFQAAIDKKVRGLFIFGEDPVVTDANQHHIVKALESLDFLVIDDLFFTESCQYADVVLPGTSYAEKEGTFSNTERRVQRVRKAVTLEGEMRLDTDIFTDLMNRMGYHQPYLTSAQIMDEIASLTPIFGGISHKRLDDGETLQWPCPTRDSKGTPILHVGKFSRGLGLFYPAKYQPSAELPDDEYPLILMTGRVLYHYNTRAMTGKTPGLMEKEGHSFIEVNTADAARLGIENGERIRVSSRRGTITSEARVSDKVSPGETWMPFHFPDGNANVLTNAALDKFARIPEYKVCAIRIEKLEQ